MNKYRILALIGIGLYALQVFSSASDENGNSLSSNFLILFSGTATLIYLITAAITLWKIGHKKTAFLLPITSLATVIGLFLTPNLSLLNLAINAVKVIAFVAYFYGTWLIFDFGGKRTVSH